MGKYFGTDGFRGEANNNLTSDHAYNICRFLGNFQRKFTVNNRDFIYKLISVFRYLINYTWFISIILL